MSFSDLNLEAHSFGMMRRGPKYGARDEKWEGEKLLLSCCLNLGKSLTFSWPFVYMHQYPCLEVSALCTRFPTVA